MSLKIKIYLGIGILFITNSAFAKEYYISPNGDDKNIGTLDRPWRTITKANQELQSGDIVYIRQGRYQETICPVRDGSEDAHIVYTGYQNEIAVIHSRSNGVYLSGKSYIIIQKLHRKL